MSNVLTRRQILVASVAHGAVSLAVCLAGPAQARVALAQATSGATAQALLIDGQPFSAEQVVEAAKLLSKRPFVAPLVNDLPDGFATMPLDQFATIRAKPAAVIWSGENRGFTVEPLHRGNVFTTPVSLFLIEDNIVRRVGYETAKFDFGKIAPPQITADIGFSGFRLAFGSERPQEFAIFQGATFFRAIARGQNFGAMARTLIIRPGEARGEEIPSFRAFWIERPTAMASVLVLHGLFDSDSMTGAVRMTLRPGDVSFIDVEVTLFARQNIDHYGLGCAMGTFLSGPQNRRTQDDVRPGVYEISGLQMLTGAHEWIYRPLNNPATLQVSSFMDVDPKGFGLVQRDRDYAAFQDDEQRFEVRPSVWVQPLGDWGDGSVQLMEIPSESEVNDNAITYWRPKKPLTAGSEISFAYRQAWCWYPPESLPLASVTRIRQGRGTQGRRRRYFVDFSGEQLADPSIVTAAQAVISATPGSIQNLRLWPYPERKTMRVAFELEPGTENVSEMRLVLQSGGRAISETWLNRWTP
jgi:periplasmic glucans biosynthesis protein